MYNDFSEQKWIDYDGAGMNGRKKFFFFSAVFLENGRNKKNLLFLEKLEKKFCLFQKTLIFFLPFIPAPS